MSNSQILTTKYSPQTFREVLGQDQSSSVKPATLDKHDSETRGKVWKSLKFALKETFQIKANQNEIYKEKLGERIIVGAIVVGIVALGCFFILTSVRMIIERYSFIGKNVVEVTKDVFSGKIITKSIPYKYSEFHFVLDCITAGLVNSLGVFLVVIPIKLVVEPILKNFKKAYQ